MTEPTALTPMPDDPSQDPKRTRWQRILEDLERERDELRVRLHLAKAEAKDELAELEQKLDDLRGKMRSAAHEADDAFDGVEDAAKRLWGEIREGFDRVRKAF